MSKTTAVLLCCAVGFGARASGQSAPAVRPVAAAVAPAPDPLDRAADAADAAGNDRLQPRLRDRIAGAGDGELLPVYFAMADRLGEAHWFPRVQRLPLPERRRLVIEELQQHATATQAPLLALLRAAGGDRARDIRSNWLGNFVQARATAAMVREAAALPGVAAVFDDEPPALAVVADAPIAAPPQPEPTTTPVPTAATARATTAIAGDGPLQTRAALVWTLGIRGQGVCIANVDGGLGAHLDLDGRRWVNPGEIDGNGVDDDGNGFVDDVNGWAFDLGGPGIDDFGGHGTQTAGLLVADGTCTGIAHGQAPAATLMTCRVLGETSHWNAVQYALLMGADIQTSSFSYKADPVQPPNYRMHRDVATATWAAGLIRCNSTGNDRPFCSDPTRPERLPLNIAAPGCVPCPYLDPNQPSGGRSGVIGVGSWRFLADALDPLSPCGPFAWSLADVRANLPAYPAVSWDPTLHDDYPWGQGAMPGLLKPDVVGPTGNVTTTAGPCRTTTFAGTSNATPCVAGVLALWKCANPSLTPEDAAMLVHQTALDRGAVAGKENDWGAGVIDAERGLLRALCVHRVDFEPAWQVRHSLQGGAVHLAVDGVPNSLCAVLVGYRRAPTPVGPLVLGIGPELGVAAAGVTDAEGHLAVSVGVGTNVAGQQFATQAVLWDQTLTQRLLDSNVVGVAFVP
ncbi:MAG: S8 family serine peptidase [Planctomycetota bacterium]